MPYARFEKDWTVQESLLGKHGDPSTNVSGIACTTPLGFPRNGLVIDDELQAAQFIELTDGAIIAGKPIPLIDDVFDGHHMSLDGEGVSFADGFFYVIGSHGHPRDAKHELDPIADAAKIAARIVASSKLLRIAPDGKVTPSQRLRKFLLAAPEIRGHVDKRLDEGGVSIEGVAVRGDMLFAGLRSPLVSGKAVILAASLKSLFGSASDEWSLAFLDLGVGMGIRDLATWNEGLLVLAGPSEGKDGDYSVHWWAPAEDGAKLLGELRPFHESGKQIKPEALLALDEDKKTKELRVLVLFDGAVNGAPLSFFVAAP